MAAAEVDLLLGRMPDSSDSSRHNLLYLLQNFALCSTVTCSDLYFNMLRKLVFIFKDQLEVRRCPPSFLFADKAFFGQLDHAISFPLTIKQEQKLTENVIKKEDASYSDIARRKVLIKRDHVCCWCKRSYKYLQNLRKHESACSQIQANFETCGNTPQKKNGN